MCKKNSKLLTISNDEILPQENRDDILSNTIIKNSRQKIRQVLMSSGEIRADNIHICNKIFLLRHEQRGDNISFDTQLTLSGQSRAKLLLCNKLEQLNITKIYCSPFIRTLQTIRPFCEKHELKINLEWSLVESIPINPVIPNEFNDIINTNYTSFSDYILPTDTEIIEFETLKLRVRTFIESITDFNSGNILFVTHLPVINAILSYKGLEFIDMFTHHRPGSLLSISGTKFF